MEGLAQDYLLRKLPDNREYINAFFQYDGYGILQTIICHPLYYVTTLTQIGYEPLPPIHVAELGSYRVYYPNKLVYMKYLCETYGFTGLYRGLIAHLAYRATRVIIIWSIKKIEYFRVEEDCRGHYSPNYGADVPETSKLLCHCRNTIVNLLAASAGISVSHPLYVIMVRRMGSVVGGETEYNGILSSALEVYRNSGISGFFTGLTHRLFSGAFGILIPSLVVYVLSYAFDLAPFRTGRSAQIAGSIIGGSIAGPISQRNKVCSNTMIVNNSGLAIGTLPYTPIFQNAFDCYGYLRQANLLTRGAGLYNRRYTGPPLTVAISSVRNPNQKLQIESLLDDPAVPKIKEV